MAHPSPETRKRLETEASSPLLYFAGPPFSKAERRFNLDLTARLEGSGFRGLSPAARRHRTRDTLPTTPCRPNSGAGPCCASTGSKSWTAACSCSCSTGASPTRGLRGVGHPLLSEGPARRWEVPDRASNRYPRGFYRLEAEPDGTHGARLRIRRRGGPVTSPTRQRGTGATGRGETR